MNVILVISDTLRRDHLGCYGNPWISTPNIDRLAAESTIFDHYYVGSYATVPVRYELLTGRHVFTYSAGWVPLPAEEVVLAQVLGRAGVASMMVADTPHILKDGFGYDRGFTAWRWLRGQETDRLRTAPLQVTLPCASEKLRNPHTNVTQYLRNVADRRGEADYFAPRTFGAAMEWLADNYGRGTTKAPPDPGAAPAPERAENPSRSFFLYVDTFDPHEPWDPPQHYVDMYDPGYDGEQVIYPKYAPAGYMTAAEERHARALYAGEVTMVDRWLGKLLAKVDDLGLRDNTAVLFASDHGFFHGEHGWWGKGLAPLYDVLNHIPLLIRVPGHTGSRCDAFVQPVDLMPTILDLSGVADPGTGHGRSLLPLLRGQTPAGWREMAISSFCFGAARPGTLGRTTLVTRGVTYVYLGNGLAELYDAKTDPEQRQNLAGDLPEVVRVCHSRLLEQLERLGTPARHLEARRPPPEPAARGGSWLGPQGRDPTAQIL